MNSRRENESFINSLFASLHLSERDHDKLRRRMYQLRIQQLASEEPQPEKENLKQIFKKMGKKSKVKEAVFSPETHACVEEVIEALRQEEGDIFVSFVGVGLVFLGRRLDHVKGWMWDDYSHFIGDHHLADEYEKQKSLTVYVRKDKRK